MQRQMLMLSVLQSLKFQKKKRKVNGIMILVSGAKGKCVVNLPL